LNAAKLGKPTIFDVVVEDEGIDPLLNGWIAADHWSITEKTPVPEPSILALLNIDIIGIGAVRKLK
jgi:hypothetical protein